jgi:hypothetical protein
MDESASGRTPIKTVDEADRRILAVLLGGGEQGGQHRGPYQRMRPGDHVYGARPASLAVLGARCHLELDQ